MECRLLLCLVIQEATTCWWYEDEKVEQMVECRRIDRLLEDVKKNI